MTAASIYTIGERVGALAIVVIFGTLGGILLGVLGGYKFPQFAPFKGYTLKPLVKGITLPPLVGMIVFGAIARNLFGESTKSFPDNWAGTIRNMCLTIVLIRGGLQVTFAGKGLLMLILCTIPQHVEAQVVAWVSKALFKMNTIVSFCLAYTLSCVGAAVVLPIFMTLNDQGYGVKKGINGALLAAGTFDVITCIIVFSIISTVLFVRIGAGDQEKPASYQIGMVFVEIITGAGVGVILALFGWFFKFIKNWKHQIHVKALWCLAVAVADVVAAQKSTFTEAKFIGALLFGYTTARIWGPDKPGKQLAQAWFFVQTLLFTTVGACLDFSKIDSSKLGFSVVVIIVGVICRAIVTFVATWSKKYTVKERIYMACAWTPKALVQAVLSGVILNEAIKLKSPEYIEYGQIIQTTAIFSIVICAPIGAILTTSLGPRLLTKDPIEDVKVESDSKDEKPENKVDTDKVDQCKDENKDNQVSPVKENDSNSIEKPIDKAMQSSADTLNIENEPKAQRALPNVVLGGNGDQI